MADIHADMTLDEVLEVKPHAKELLFEYGLFSENAIVQSMETLREAASSHGMDDEKFNELIEQLETI